MADRQGDTAELEQVGPTTRRRQLGLRLLALREEAGLSAGVAGERAGVSQATVSRYERGHGNVRWNQVEALCRVYGTTDEETQELISLAKHSKATEGWWVPYAGRLSRPMRLLLAIEDEASRVEQYAAGVVPGLLQTLEYAKAIKQTPGSTIPPEDVDEYLAMRMHRQQILDRATPPEFQVVLDESVLRRVVGDPETTGRQLDHLLSRGAEPNITIQVLPFSQGVYAAALGNVIVYGGADPSLDVIFIETAGGSLFLEEPEARQVYAQGLAFLREEALAPDASAQLIAEVRSSHLRKKRKK
ncbi:helix-turn-helix domain-containing protein [Streptomyces triticirhizae]|uniref:XRE family transcriptional regulator n=1 Tax=Streptomyces triticirhizae TaxID=2483353 RepID=A0A3M2MAF3_9ACTN|nr:helix-turn-helix transcriptional regulator [Streptomyces triticirhizae]RMI46764.1 XRE family transcriptional regulator [Streptomyces triticirhizae]